MKKRVFIILLALMSYGLSYGQVDTVINRYRTFLMTTTRVQPEHINKWVKSLQVDGRWPDIDYSDQSRANWQLWDHLKRLDALAVAWSKPGSAFYHDPELWKSINLALDNWLRHKYHNPNWWHNQIGVPQCMRDVLVLLRKQLNARQLRDGVEVLGQLQVQGNGAGANLIWSADLGLHYGALTGDTVLMDSCRRLILREIHISTGEGIEPDYSFHQHGSRLQMYQYGKAFLFTNVRLAWECQHTSWAFPEDKIRLLTDFLLKGWQWMARGVNTVPGTMDRSASRLGELRSPDLREILPLLLTLQPDKTAQWKQIGARQHGRGNALSGFRYFPYSDFAAYQRPHFSFFLKTISSRTLPSEVGLNSENLKGRLMNSGAAYFIRNGQEYYDMMPVWNWQKLPGVTAFDKAARIERQPFVGSVSNGSSGLSAMDYCMTDTSGTRRVKAHKVWAAHGDVVVCLMADLNITGKVRQVYTAMDQCRAQGMVVAGNRHGEISTRTGQLGPIKWLFHHGLAYFPLYDGVVKLRSGSVKGSWSDINASEVDSLITDSVVLPVIYHDAKKPRQSAGYAVAYCPNAAAAAALSKRPSWTIIRNDSSCQVIGFADGTVMAAFFAAGSVSVGKAAITVDRPCLILKHATHAFASDPLHEGGTLHLQFGNRSHTAHLPVDGSTLQVF